MPVRIVRSSRRKRTVSARLIDGSVEVRVPAGMKPDDEARLVHEMVEKTRRRTSAAHVDLTRRAAELAERYDLPRPASIEWSSRQMRRWGSCTPSEQTIRISNRLAEVPPWVLDSVLVHELAHLEVPGHGPRFQTLVARYHLTERATGYLMALDEGRTAEV